MTYTVRILDDVPDHHKIWIEPEPNSSDICSNWLDALRNKKK